MERSEKRVIDGIGFVTRVYVNPKTRYYWIIASRIYDPDRDGKTKLEHLASEDSVCPRNVLGLETLLQTIRAATWAAPTGSQRYT